MPSIRAEDIAQMARDLAKTAASPAFLELVQRIQAAPESEKLGVAQNIADVEMLMKHGIEAPPNFRISTRTFEDPPAYSRDVDVNDSPQLACGRDRIVLTFQGIVTVVEVIRDGD